MSDEMNGMEAGETDRTDIGIEELSPEQQEYLSSFMHKFNNGVQEVAYGLMNECISHELMQNVNATELAELMVVQMAIIPKLIRYEMKAMSMLALIGVDPDSDEGKMLLEATRAGARAAIAEELNISPDTFQS